MVVTGTLLFSLNLTNNCHVNFAQVGGTLQQQIDSLWETNFGNEFQPNVTTIVLDNFYVDHSLCSVSSVDAGLTVLAQLPKLLQKGGFHLTKWLMNNYELLHAIPESER